MQNERKADAEQDQVQVDRGGNDPGHRRACHLQPHDAVGGGKRRRADAVDVVQDPDDGYTDDAPRDRSDGQHLRQPFSADMAVIRRLEHGQTYGEAHDHRSYESFQDEQRHDVLEGQAHQQDNDEGRDAHAHGHLRPAPGLDDREERSDRDADEENPRGHPDEEVQHDRSYGDNDEQQECQDFARGPPLPRRPGRPAGFFHSSPCAGSRSSAKNGFTMTYSVMNADVTIIDIDVENTHGFSMCEV